MKTSKYDPVFERQQKKQPWQLRLWPMRANPEGVRFSRSAKRFEVVVAGRRCLEAGTMVATPRGPLPIEQIRPGDIVYGFNEDESVSETIVSAIHVNGLQNVFPLTSSGKKYASATEKHRFWACDEALFDKRRNPDVQKLGFKRRAISEISKRSRIKRVYLYDLFRGGDKVVPFTYSLGALLGNGCSLANKITTGELTRFLYLSDEDGTVARAIAEEIGGYEAKLPSDNYTWKVGGVADILSAIPFYREWCCSRYAHEKIAVWEEIDSWSKESCLSFLAGIVDTDGSIFYKNDSTKEVVVQIGMQAKSVVECCQKIIYKYFQESLNISEDKREKYKNGHVWSVKTSSNLLSKRVYEAIFPFLRKKNLLNLSSIEFRNILPDMIGLAKGNPYLAPTYDITVSNNTNLYVLHDGGLVTSNSGKTERAKRKFVKRVLRGNNGTFINPRYCVSAPTTAQAKKIFWNDLKMMIPPNLMAKKPNETDLIIQLIPGNTEIFVAGLDQPQRIEGAPVDGFVFDECDDIKPTAWEAHIYPCFADRHAWAMFLGAPNGMGFLHKASKNALMSPAEWDFFQWKSAEVLDPAEIQRFRSLYDDRLFRQEFEGEFVPFDGRAYYAFEKKHCAYELDYNIHADLMFCFDFNSTPGTAAILQEMKMPFGQKESCHTQNGFVYQSKLQDVWGTGVISEIWVKENSNTKLICEKLYAKFHMHQGKIYCYGDASGGNQTSSGLNGSDWDIIKDFFARTPFADRIFYNVPRANPSVRGRINAVNCRLKASDGTIRMAIDAVDCPHIIEDFDMVTLLNGSLSDINKKKNMFLTHLTDAIGSYVAYEFPIDNLSKVSILDW